MKFFKRILNLGKAEAHNLMDKMEDPVKMTEQGIKELKGDLSDSLKNLAEVKALAIRASREAETNAKAAKEYENKAVLLLQKANTGEITQEKADGLAAQMLEKKADAEKRAQLSRTDAEKLNENVRKLEVNVQKLKRDIGAWENELKTLKARAKVSEATQKLNKNLAQVDSSSTVAMLERMRQKVDEQEAISQSYAEIAGAGDSSDDEVNRILGGSTTDPNSSLEALKEKMRLEAGSNQTTEDSAENNHDTAGGAAEPEAPVAPETQSSLDELKAKLAGDRPASEAEPETPESPKKDDTPPAQ
jgi:phage shock protein A